MSENGFTITRVIHLAKWWQLPWFWIQRKPTERKETYYNCHWTSMEVVGSDDFVEIQYGLYVPPQAKTVNINSSLKIGGQDE